MELSLNKKIAGVVVAILALFGVSSVSTNFGSVARSSEYHAKTSAAIWANVPKQIFDGAGTFGSIVIGTTDATIVEFRDATSSTDIASTTIAIVAASPAIGSTMTFDYAVKRGLFVNTTSAFSAGRYTITYR